MLKRICIFCFYDPAEIVDEYVTYLLDDIKPLIDKFVIVCNCDIESHEKDKFLKYSDEVIIRENIGFDGGAYQDILLNHLKKDELEDYDELILMNDTFFGPFYPFEEIFDAMDKKICDIWGMTKHGKFWLDGKEKSSHIQSYFLVIKKNVFLSDIFSLFWCNMKVLTSFNDAVSNFEIEFSRQMSTAGFILETYLDAERFISPDSSKNYNYPELHCGQLIRDYRFPLVKKKWLVIGHKNNNNPVLAMDYISSHTFYDTNLIWQNLLRRYDMSDIIKSLSLLYIIKEDVKFDCDLRKIGIVILIHRERQLNTIMQYLLQIPRELKLYFIIVDNAIRIDDIRRYKLNNPFELRNEGSMKDLQVIYMKCKDLFFKYDYLCVLSDEEAIDRQLITIEQLLQDSFSSCLSNIEYIISLFEKHSRLGVLFPFSVRLNYVKWGKSIYEDSKKFCEYYNIPVRFHRGKNMVDSGTSFWCRTKAIVNTLSIKKFSDFTEWEWINWLRCLPYTYQANGYYAGYISTIDQRERVIDQDDEQGRVIDQDEEQEKAAFLKVKNKYNMLTALTKQLMGESINKVYIYGCGKVAGDVYEVCEDAGIIIEAFIVSDSQKKAKSHLGKEVIWISDYKNDEGDIIIVGVGRKLKHEITSLLDQRGNRYISF